MLSLTPTFSGVFLLWTENWLLLVDTGIHIHFGSRCCTILLELLNLSCAYYWVAKQSYVWYNTIRTI